MIKMDIHDRTELKELFFDRLMDFTSDTNPLGPSSKAKHAVRKNIKLLGYQSRKEVEHLTDLISKRENIHQKNILVGPDPIYALHGFLKLMSVKKTLIPCPLSDSYKTLLKKLGARVVPFHLDGEQGFGFEVDKFVMKMENADCIILQNPHRMTGTTLCVEEINSIIKRAKVLNKVVIIDESGMDFCEGSLPVKKIVHSEHTLLLRTFSDFYALTGFRFGYVMGHSRLLQDITEHLNHPPINTLAAVAAIASLRDKRYRERTLLFIRGEKDYIKGSLDGMDTVHCIDTGCNFLILRLKKKIENPTGYFLMQRILIESFIDKKGTCYVKLPVKKHKWNAYLMRTLKKCGR